MRTVRREQSNSLSRLALLSCGMQNSGAAHHRAMPGEIGEIGNWVPILRYGTQLLEEPWDRCLTRFAAGAAGSGRRDETHDTMLGEIMT